MKTYTEGPWEYVPEYTEQGITHHKIRTLEKANQFTGWEVCQVNDRPSLSAIANTRLIAAAPELFEVLTWALGLIDDDLDLDNQTALEHAKNILKKAKGGV